MSEQHRIDRKHFLKLTISCAGAGATAWLVGCSADDTVDPGTAGTTSGSSGSTSGAAGKGGGGAGGSAGTNSTAGTGGSGGSTAGTGGSGGAGTSGSAGTAGNGGAGAGGAGAGGTAGGGAGGGGAGGTAGGTAGGGTGGGGTAGGGTGGTAGAFGGAGSGGSGGASGGAAGAGGKGGGTCGTLSFAQNTNCMPRACQPHDHVPNNAQQAMMFFQDLLDHINGPDALMPYALPTEGPTPHTHALIFTQDEIDTLRSGGTLTAKTPEPDELDEVHIYTISCG